MISARIQRRLASARSTGEIASTRASMSITISPRRSWYLASRLGHHLRLRLNTREPEIHLLKHLGARLGVRGSVSSCSMRLVCSLSVAM